MSLLSLSLSLSVSTWYPLLGMKKKSRKHCGRCQFKRTTSRRIWMMKTDWLKSRGMPTVYIIITCNYYLLNVTIYNRTDPSFIAASLVWISLILDDKTLLRPFRNLALSCYVDMVKEHAFISIVSTCVCVFIYHERDK